MSNFHSAAGIVWTYSTSIQGFSFVGSMLTTNKSFKAKGIKILRGGTGYATGSTYCALYDDDSDTASLVGYTGPARTIDSPTETTDSKTGYDFNVYYQFNEPVEIRRDKQYFIRYFNGTGTPPSTRGTLGSSGNNQTAIIFTTRFKNDGEKIYRNGISPKTYEMKAYQFGNVLVDSDTGIPCTVKFSFVLAD